MLSKRLYLECWESNVLIVYVIIHVWNSYLKSSGSSEWKLKMSAWQFEGKSFQSYDWNTFRTEKPNEVDNIGLCFRRIRGLKRLKFELVG